MENTRTNELALWLDQMRQWLGEMREKADEIADVTYRNAFHGRKLLVSSSDPKAYFQNHGINTAIHAALIARALEYPLAEIRIITLGALVHDVGNVYLPEQLLQKPGMLTREEMERVKSHTRLGADLLRTLGAPDDVVRVALEHHERMDGTGYPVGVEEAAIHPYARLCALADAYGALTSARPFAPAVTPRQALETVKNHPSQFDAKLVEQLARLD